jgi:aerobic carbon-monoxide dehydrogenase medium subunit
MHNFAYYRPGSARQAVNLLAKLGGDSKVLAGGQSLLPMMKLRLVQTANIVDLGGIEDLRGIARSGRSITIGAMTRHADVEASADVKEAIPALHEMVKIIGDPAVRAQGTIGGSIANNDPAADYPAACTALGATIVTNKRKIAADDFFKGLFETALEDGEIIIKVQLPVPLKAGYAKFRHPASRFALVGVFVAKRGSEVRVAVTGAGANGVFRWKEAEAALKQRFGLKSLEGLKASKDGLNSDIHADADYRAHLVGVMTRRAVAQAVGK